MPPANKQEDKHIKENSTPHWGMTRRKRGSCKRTLKKRQRERSGFSREFSETRKRPRWTVEMKFCGGAIWYTVRFGMRTRERWVWTMKRKQTGTTKSTNNDKHTEQTLTFETFELRLNLIYDTVRASPTVGAFPKDQQRKCRMHGRLTSFRPTTKQNLNLPKRLYGPLNWLIGTLRGDLPPFRIDSNAVGKSRL